MYTPIPPDRHAQAEIRGHHTQIHPAAGWRIQYGVPLLVGQADAGEAKSG
jgi:hypothetical protein